VTVIGDASYSMDVAIRVSTVIASVLTLLAGAELKFFTGVSVDPPLIPKNVPQVLEVATGVKADGLTAPAAALWPYYKAKKIVKFFIIVTDEIENEKFNNYFFPTLFQKYYNEVYPAKIVFASFLENPSIKGRMVIALENMGIVPLQFKLDGKRPDLTKLDTFLGLLSSESTFFPTQVKELRDVIMKDGFKGALEQFAKPIVVKNNNNDSGKEEVQEPSEKSLEVVVEKLKELKTMDNSKEELKGSTEKPSDVDDHVPQAFLDPVTLKLMRDPVIAPSGHTFEREVISEHIVRYNNNPFTRDALTIEQLMPNRALKEAIDEFLAKRVKK